MSQPISTVTGDIGHLLRQWIEEHQAPSPQDIEYLVGEVERRHQELEKQNEELRKAQRRLEAYKDRYVDLYDFAPLAYITLDDDGFVQEINLAGAKLLGAEREALIGYAFGDYVAPQDRKVFQDHLGQCVRERREVTTELRLATQNGRSLTTQFHSIPIEGPLEDTLCKTAITDITERRNMEEAIRQSRSFLQMVIDAIPDPMLVIGRDYRISLANRVAREMAGGVDPTVCLTCHQLSHHRKLPCEGRNEPCPLREVVAAKAPVTVMHVHYDANGKEVFVEISAAPVFDEAGEVIHIIEACRDITQRRQVEAALEREHSLLRTLIDHLPDCIYIKDTQGRFIAANLATALLMGATTPNDLLGKTDTDFYPPELVAAYRADEEEILRSGQPLVNKNEPHSDAAGRPRTILTTKIPLQDNQGEVFGLLGISRDITSIP